MTPALEAALSSPFARAFVALEVLAPSFALRLLDGASEVDFGGGRVFAGSDPAYGTLGQIQAVTEGVGTEAPRMRLEIRPPSLAGAAALALPENQNSEVRLYFGAVHLDTGAVIADPLLIFWGELDVPRYMAGKRSRRIEFDVYSAWERLFADSEGERLNHAFHTKAFPNDRGLEYVSDVERQLPWGADVPKSRAISTATGVGGGTGSGGGGIGGGGGGGGGMTHQELAMMMRQLF